MDPWQIAERIASAAIVAGVDLSLDPDETSYPVRQGKTIHSAVGTSLDMAMLRCTALDLVPMPLHFPSAASLVEYWRVSAEDRYFAIWGYEYPGVDPLAQGTERYARSLTDTRS